jgi:methylthioribose-1-phosphate isomerase
MNDTKTLTAESVIRQSKYASLKNLVLICDAMDEFASQKAESFRRQAQYWEDAHARLEVDLKEQIQTLQEALKVARPYVNSAVNLFNSHEETQEYLESEAALKQIDKAIEE